MGDVSITLRYLGVAGLRLYHFVVCFQECEEFRDDDIAADIIELTGIHVLLVFFRRLFY